VNVFFTSTTVVLNHFAEESQMQTTILLQSRTKNSNTSQLARFFIAPTKSFSQDIRGVTERLLRTAQRMLGSCMRLLEECLRTIVYK